MKTFLNCRSVYRHFSSDENFRISCIGYNDFHLVKAAYTFYQQNFYTWHFVISGKGTLEMAGKKYDIREGEMFFIPPNTMMRYYPDKDTPWEYVWISTVGDKMQYYGKYLGFSLENAVLRIPLFQRVCQIFKNIFDIILNNAEIGYYSALSDFYKIIDLCTISTIQDIPQKAKNFIDTNFADPVFRIQHLCTDICISHAHLLRLFKKSYGITPSMYLAKKRIEWAQKLLSETNDSIHSIAYSCGFSDHFHFMKVFKKHTGITALAYRKMRDMNSPVTNSEKKAPLPK